MVTVIPATVMSMQMVMSDFLPKRPPTMIISKKPTTPPTYIRVITESSCNFY
jgi:hypothetical protein